MWRTFTNAAPTAGKGQLDQLFCKNDDDDDDDDDDVDDDEDDDDDKPGGAR